MSPLEIQRQRDGKWKMQFKIWPGDSLTSTRSHLAEKRFVDYFFACDKNDEKGVLIAIPDLNQALGKEIFLESGKPYDIEIVNKLGQSSVIRLVHSPDKEE